MSTSRKEIDFSLHGMAIALTGTEEEEGTFTLSQQVSTRPGLIKLVPGQTETIKFCLKSENETKEAIEKVLRRIGMVPDTEFSIGNHTVNIPTTVVYGVHEHTPSAPLEKGLKRACPDLLKDRTNIGVLNTLKVIILEGYKKLATHERAQRHIAIHDAMVYAPSADDGHIKNDPKKIENIEILIEEAKKDLLMAKLILEALAIADADSILDEYEKRNIPIPRFVQFGKHNEKDKSSPRYTYMEVEGVKDIFAARILSRLKVGHNICVRTPNDNAAPFLADISATRIQDIWCKLFDKSPVRVEVQID